MCSSGAGLAAPYTARNLVELLVLIHGGASQDLHGILSPPKNSFLGKSSLLSNFPETLFGLWLEYFWGQQMSWSSGLNQVVFPELSQFLLKLQFLLLELLNVFQLCLLWELLVFLRQYLGQLLVTEFGVHLGIHRPLLLEEVEVSSQSTFVCFSPVLLL